MAIENAGKRFPHIVIYFKILDDALLLYILLPVIRRSFAVKGNDLGNLGSLVFFIYFLIPKILFF